MASKEKKRVARWLRITQPALEASIGAGHLAAWRMTHEEATALREASPAWLVEAQREKRAQAQPATGPKTRTEYASQTEIGVVLGISAVAVGKLLDAEGLRDQGIPVAEALRDRLAIECATSRGNPYYRWDKKRTLALLAEAGHQPADSATQQQRQKAEVERAKHRRARSDARAAYEALDEATDGMDEKVALLMLDSADDPELAWRYFAALRETSR